MWGEVGREGSGRRAGGARDEVCEAGVGIPHQRLGGGVEGAPPDYQPHPPHAGVVHLQRLS